MGCELSTPVTHRRRKTRTTTKSAQRRPLAGTTGSTNRAPALAPVSVAPSVGDSHQSSPQEASLGSLKSAQSKRSLDPLGPLGEDVEGSIEHAPRSTSPSLVGLVHHQGTPPQTPTFSAQDDDGWTGSSVSMQSQGPGLGAVAVMGDDEMSQMPFNASTSNSTASNIVRTSTTNPIPNTTNPFSTTSILAVANGKKTPVRVEAAEQQQQPEQVLNPLRASSPGIGLFPPPPAPTTTVQTTQMQRHPAGRSPEPTTTTAESGTADVVETPVASLSPQDAPVASPSMSDDSGLLRRGGMLSILPSQQQQQLQADFGEWMQSNSSRLSVSIGHSQGQVDLSRLSLRTTDGAPQWSLTEEEIATLFDDLQRRDTPGALSCNEPDNPTWWVRVLEDEKRKLWSEKQGK